MTTKTIEQALAGNGYPGEEFCSEKRRTARMR